MAKPLIPLLVDNDERVRGRAVFSLAGLGWRPTTAFQRACMAYANGRLKEVAAEGEAGVKEFGTSIPGNRIASCDRILTSWGRSRSLPTGNTSRSAAGFSLRQLPDVVGCRKGCARAQFAVAIRKIGNFPCVFLGWAVACGGHRAIRRAPCGFGLRSAMGFDQSR